MNGTPIRKKARRNIRLGNRGLGLFASSTSMLFPPIPYPQSMLFCIYLVAILYNTHYGPGPVLSTSQTLSHLILTTLSGRCYYYPHFTGAETEAQRG